MMLAFEDELSAAPEEENVFDDYELYVAAFSYDGRSLTVVKKGRQGTEEAQHLNAPSRQMGRRVAFYEGDLIQITDNSTSFGGWWKGSLNGVSGIFPSCLLEALDSSLPTLATLEDTMASMDSLLAHLSTNSSVMSAVMDITPRSGEKEIEKLANRLEHVADTTSAPDVEVMDALESSDDFCESLAEEEAEGISADGMDVTSSGPGTAPVTDIEKQTCQEESGSRKREGARVVRPASIRISKGDGTVVTKVVKASTRATAAPLQSLASHAPSSAQTAPPSNIRSIRTIKVTKGATGPVGKAPQALSSVASSGPGRGASSRVATVTAIRRGSGRKAIVNRGGPRPRNSVTEVVVTGNSPQAAPPQALLSNKKASAPLSLRRPAGGDEDMPLAPPPAAALKSRAALEEDSPLDPPPGDRTTHRVADFFQTESEGGSEELEEEGDAEEQDGEEDTEEEEELDLEDLPDMEKTIRQPDEPAPPLPRPDPMELDSPRAFVKKTSSATQRSPRGSRFSLDLAVVSERMKSIKEDVFRPITPGTRARLHSLPRPDEPAPKCPFDFDPYKDSYDEEGHDDVDHFNDSSDEETPRKSSEASSDAGGNRVQCLSPREGEALQDGDAAATGGGGGVQLRAKTKKRLKEKAQRKQARGQHYKLSRASSAPSVKEVSDVKEQEKEAALSASDEQAKPKRALSSMKAEEVAAINTSDVQLRPRVRKALGAKKKKPGPGQQMQRLPIAALQKRELSSDQPSTPKTAAEKRRFNYYEVVATERSYVKSMEQLVQVMAGLIEIQRKLTEAGDTGAALPAELQTLHVSATIILGYSKKTLEMMGPRLQSYNDQTCIGDIFLLVADFLKIYTQYVRGYEPFVNKFLIARQKNKLLREQVEKYEMSVGSFITFESHLIVPVQRIPRYSLLLNDMLRNTHEEHPDYHLLAEAVRKIERVADFVNARQTVYENLNKVIELEKKYGKQLTEQTGISQFVRSHRRVIKEASLFLCSSDSKPKRVHVSLLNDLLVVGTTSRQSTIMNWGGCKLLNVVCLWLVDLKNVTDVAGRQHCFELVMEASSETVLVLKCSSEEEKRDWMEELSAVKQMLNKAINVGAKTAEQKKRISIALNVKWTSPVIPQEIALALAEEQAQRRQQANMQMMPISRGSSEHARITELPSEITNALRRESNKKAKRRSRVSSGESADELESSEERSCRGSIDQQQLSPRSKSPPGSVASIAAAERARSPVAKRMKKSKSAAKLRKTLSPLSRHKDAASKSGPRVVSPMRGKDKMLMEEKEEKTLLSPRSLKLAKESSASPWSPKMLKLRLGKSKEKVEDKPDLAREKRKEEKIEKRRKDDRRKDEKEKEGRKREEKEEKRKEKKGKADDKLVLDMTTLAPSGMRSGLSPKSEKVSPSAKKTNSGKKSRSPSSSFDAPSLGDGEQDQSNASCERQADVPCLRSSATRRKTRRSVSVGNVEQPTGNVVVVALPTDEERKESIAKKKKKKKKKNSCEESGDSRQESPLTKSS